MKLPTKHSLALAFALALASPVNVFATNGLFMIGYGAKGTAMGGAGVAYPQDAMAVAYNPASMTEVGEARLDATVEFFRPPRSVTHDGSVTLSDTNVRSKDDLFPIPAIGAVLSSPGTPIAMGMAVIGAGLGTNYAQPDNTFYDAASSSPDLDGYNRVGVFLMQMQMLPSMAYKLNENHSVGASLVIAAQTFRAFGLEAFSSVSIPISGDPSKLTNNGYDWSFGWGWRAGWFGKFLDGKLNLGLDYAPRVSMQKFNRYSGLFAEHGEFDIPESITAGLAIKLTPKMNVAFDVQRIYWNDIASIGNPGPVDAAGFNPLCPGPDTDVCKLGGDLGMGFGWTNQTVYKLGFDYKYRSNLVLRAGYNYGKTPIPRDQVLFNMLAPATTERHITFGGTYTLANKDELSFGFMHAFEKTISGPTAFRQSGTAGPGENAAITMSQTSFSIAYGVKF